MKKKTNIIIGILIILLIIISIIVIVYLNKDNKKEINTYSTINIDGYQFTINDQYQYKYLEDKKYGVLENKDFLSSYIYVSDTGYVELIRKTSTYTNMGSNELDSSIEEMKFGSYSGFINIKKVHYDDVNKDYELVIILIQVNEEKTLVFQYEKEINDENDEILEDIKTNLSTIKEI